MTATVMAATTAKAMVRAVSYCLDHAYAARYCRDMYGGTARRERAWAKAGLVVQRLTWPMARRLDRAAMTDQMVKECWWG